MVGKVRMKKTKSVYRSKNKKKDAWYTDPAFQKEQQKWYKKLKKEGFRDVETFDWSTGETFHILNTKTYKSTAEAVRDYDPHKERYFELARQRYWDMKEFLENCPFWLRTKEAEQNLEIWNMWADGQRMSDIKRSRLAKKHKWTATRIRKVVRDTEACMLAELKGTTPIDRQ